MSREIILKGKYGGIALVDDDDYLKVKDYNWVMAKEGYVFFGKYNSGKRTRILLHRLIMRTPKGYFTDHRNHNRLDNRKENLRVCTAAQNSFNRLKSSKILGYKGIYFNKDKQKWRADIHAYGKRIFLGLFESDIIAAKAYDIAAKKYHKEFAQTNFDT